MIKLTEVGQTTPYRWVHPDDDDAIPSSLMKTAEGHTPLL
jgi:hypothetical protein